MTATRLVALILLSGCALKPQGISQEAPRPEQLNLKARPFRVPRVEEHRVLLFGKVPAYIGQDRAAPVLRVTLIYRTGMWLDPPGKEGLAEAAAFLLRHGGTKALTPEAFDRELESRAIELSAVASQDSFRVAVWSLAKEREKALELLSQAVSSPRFDRSRLALWKGRKLQALKALHDRPEEVLRLYWRDIIWGENHVVGRRPTKSSVEGITREDLLDWHRKYFCPGNLFVVATSDMPAEKLKGLLEKKLSSPLMAESLKAYERKNAFARLPKPPPPKPPGVYLVRCDVPQGAVRIGHRGIYWTDERLVAFRLVSYVFGEGSFQSRLTERIRTKEGLTYGIFSYVIPGWIFPGTTIVQSSSKPQNVAKVISLVREEIEKLTKEGLRGEEIEKAKKTVIARFAGMFEDLHDTLVALCMLEYRGRPLDFYAKYRERIRNLTSKEIREAARDFLKPEELRILIAGDIEGIRKASAACGMPLENFGPVKILQIRDPMQ